MLREEHIPKVSESEVLRRIHGPEREEVVGGSRKLHTVETDFILQNVTRDKECTLA